MYSNLFQILKKKKKKELINSNKKKIQIKQKTNKNIKGV